MNGEHDDPTPRHSAGDDGLESAERTSEAAGVESSPTDGMTTPEGTPVDPAWPAPTAAPPGTVPTAGPVDSSSGRSEAQDGYRPPGQHAAPPQPPHQSGYQQPYPPRPYAQGPVLAQGPVAWHDYAPPRTAATSPFLADVPARPRRRLLSVGATALLVGIAGGLAGSAIYDRIEGPGGVGRYEGGLADVDLADLPPVKPGGVAAVAEALLPSTVQIFAEAGSAGDSATGSGFVLDKQGHIVTNNHVVEGAADEDGQIQVVDSEGERYDAQLVGRSPVYDLAVLFLPDADGLEPAALGAAEQLRVGDGVVAIGSPLGLSSTVTAGIVSALNRPVTTGALGDVSSYINAVQTDAAINPGNSGGPLVNLAGQVVGVNTAIATAGGGSMGAQSGNIGVGFAIPVEQVRVTADQILKTGEARYPVIGAQVRTAGTQTLIGATIDEVSSGAPADDAGLESGDIVVAVEGVRVTDGISLIVNIRTHQPGDTIEVTYLRGGDERTAKVKLAAEVG
ncbi:S1C family serine protease [Nocardioides sp. R-C-SC26]|uniref:S1C family serine protease n=1 Tax=Nocardioides sp. R-C-SC26 TaxID=2870414 RepID=UPI001E518267|nr:trypsin-like peptidase domain-containing protein [Nocardioides sp. R-C-SC26]